MDPVTLTVTFKGVGMLAIIAGGILISRYGFHLYRDGAGTGRDKTVIEAGPIRVKAHSVGSVVMASAFLWAWAAVAISPSLDKKGDEVRVYSFNTPAGAVESRVLATHLPRERPASHVTPDELQVLFREAVEKSSQRHPEGVGALSGTPAKFDPASLTVTSDESGTYQINALLRAGQETALIEFDPEIHGREVLFVPSNAMRTD